MLSLRPHCRQKPHNQSINPTRIHRNISIPLHNECTHAAREHPARLSPGFRTLWSQALQLFTSVALIAGRLSIPEVARC